MRHTTARIAGIQRILRDIQSQSPGIGENDQDTLLKSHGRFLDLEFRTRLKRYEQDLVGPFAKTGPIDSPIRGQLVTRATGPFSEEVSTRSLDELSFLRQASECSQTVLFQPPFDVASPLLITETAGEMTTLARGSLDGSLEVATSVGPFPPLAPIKTFDGTPSGTAAVYNFARASVGKLFALPASTDYRLADATVLVRLEQTQGRQPISWDNFAAVLPGPAALPLSGLAVAWCDIIVSMHTVAGSAYGFTTIVGADVASSRDEDVNGDLYAIPFVRAVLAPEVTSFTLMVDARAFVWAEGAEDKDQGFAELSVHEQLPGEDLLSFGFATAQGVLRVDEIVMKVCPVPILSRQAATKSGRGTA